MGYLYLFDSHEPLGHSQSGRKHAQLQRIIQQTPKCCRPPLAPQLPRRRQVQFHTIHATVNHTLRSLIAPKNLHYLYELIEIAINTQNFTSTTKRALNNKMTHAAIDILTNLSEEFMDLVFEGEQDDEDEVVQT